MKDRINLENAVIKVDNAFSASMSDQSKYQFVIKVPTS